MLVTSRADRDPDCSNGWGEQPGTELRWLIDQDVGARQGAVALVEIEPDGGQAPHRHEGAEEVDVVVAGKGVFGVNGVERPVEAGAVLHAPAGARHWIRAGASPMTVLAVIGGNSGSRLAGWKDDPSVRAGEPMGRLLGGDERPEQVIHDPKLGFIEMRARWIADSDLLSEPGVAIGASRFGAESRHEMHRHPEAEEFFLVLAGNGEHVTGDGDTFAAGPGDIAFVGRSEWHSFRNAGDEEVVALFGYLGVGHVRAAGYALPET